MDLIDGWSTGDPLLDFIFVSCNGIYDPWVIYAQYKRLFDLGLRKPGQKIMVIQKAEFNTFDGPVIIRNIHMAELRPDVIESDIDSFTIKIPVKTGHFVWKELIQERGLIMSCYKTFKDEWLKTGPLYNQYCDYGAVRNDNDGFLYVPDDAVCEIELLPDTDKIILFQDHGINEEMLDKINHAWVKELTKS